jgi:hypothetical protein
VRRVISTGALAAALALALPTVGLAAADKKACKLLKRAELEKALHLDLKKGKPPSRRLTGNCVWRVKRTADFVQLVVLPGAAADELETGRESFGDMEPVSGVGDEAYFTPSGRLLLVFDGEDAVELGGVFFEITGEPEDPEGGELRAPFVELAQKALERR